MAKVYSHTALRKKLHNARRAPVMKAISISLYKISTCDVRTTESLSELRGLEASMHLFPWSVSAATHCVWRPLVNFQAAENAKAALQWLAEKDD